MKRGGADTPALPRNASSCFREVPVPFRWTVASAGPYRVDDSLACRGGGAAHQGAAMFGTSATLRLRAVRALVLACGIGAAVPAAAQIGSERYAAIVVDARSGNALIAANPDERRSPASLAKMMTVSMAFEALRDGRITL